MSGLVLASASYDAARYACTRWHYSASTPAAKLAIIGAWEDHTPEPLKFVGVCVFTWGASPILARSLGFAGMTECLELARVALREHEHPVSQIVSGAVDLVTETSPRLRAIVSFADPAYGHHGGIYQAMNWLYLGTSSPGTGYVVDGVRRHSRQVNAWRRGDPARSELSIIDWLRAHVDPGAYAVVTPPKHRYLLPLDKPTRRRFTQLAQPYPQRAGKVSTVTRLDPV